MLLILFFCVQIEAQKRTMVLSGNIGLMVPIGDFGEVTRTGIGGTANLRYLLSEEVEIIGVFGYLLSGSKILQFTNKVLPGLIGCRFYPVGKFDQLIKPYLSGLAGFQYTKIGFSRWSFDSKTYYGASIGGGFLYGISEKLDLDVGLSIYLMDKASYITFMVGLSSPL